jgi:hypothetical protein
VQASIRLRSKFMEPSKPGAIRLCLNFQPATSPTFWTLLEREPTGGSAKPLSPTHVSRAVTKWPITSVSE